MAKISANPTKLRNASLAIQLSYDWIRRDSHKLPAEIVDACSIEMNRNELILAPKIVEALIDCNWPGRCQTVHWENMTLYIDGAHTFESLQLCLDWFAAMTKSRLKIILTLTLKENSEFSIKMFFYSCHKRFLLFNVTGDRNAMEMLKLVNTKIQFEQALFTPNVSSLSSQAKGIYECNNTSYCVSSLPNIHVHLSQRNQRYRIVLSMSS